jgi:phosphate transport system substrate-binding protein
MKRAGTRHVAGVAVLGAISLALSACGGGGDGGGGSTGGGGLSGTLAGAGSTAQEAAIKGWIAGFNEANPDVVVSYDAVGSGGGREQFISGAVQWAGSDAYLSPEEVSGATERCGGDVVELPLYISPIAVIYNLPGVDTEHVQLSAETIAKIFTGEITNWNDPAIAAENAGVTFPDLAITPVHRSDDSGTTKNFTDYLEKASNGAWTYEADGEWPISGGQSGQGTQGLVDVVTAAEGAIGYADESRAGDLGTAALKVGDAYVPVSAEGAAAVVDASPAAEGASDTQLTIAIDRTTTQPGAYPLVLVSYDLACLTYEDPADAANVKAFLTYVASEEGQARAAEPAVAGSAPISADLHQKVQAVIDQISAA